MKKLNNKGFSLVELIIVIAIMAILIGVVGTQVIPYLENSRKAKDKQVLSSLNTAGMSTYTSCAGQLNGNYSYRIEVTNEGDINVYYQDNESAAYNEADASWHEATDAEKGSGMVAVYKSLTGLTGAANQITSQMTSKDGRNVTKVDIYIPFEDPMYTKVTSDPANLFEIIENK